MLRNIARSLKSRRKHAKRLLLAFAVLVVLAVGVAARCTRETIWVGDRLYGGRQYSDFVSCGSSAGNFAYTCAENGQCYENPSIDTSQYCHCNDEMLTQ